MRTDFDFDAWKREQAEKRARRRSELRAALEAGLAIWHGGSVWSTAGIISPAGRFGNPDTHAFAVFLEPYQSDPAYLADHIENREYGFGFETTIIRRPASPETHAEHESEDPHCTCNDYMESFIERSE